LRSLNVARDALAGQIIAVLEAAEFGGGHNNASLLSNQHLQQLTANGHALLKRANTAANGH